jgi:hypothetical protein
MAYTFYIMGSLTASQEEKFLSGILARDEDGLDEGFHASFRGLVRQVIGRYPVRDPDPIVSYVGSPAKRAPQPYGGKSVPQDSNILEDLRFFETRDSIDGIDLFARYPNIYLALLKGVGRRKEELVNSSNWMTALIGPQSRSVQEHSCPVYGGEIHFIQEPGGKLRSVASPLRIHQEAMKPLGKVLYGIVQQQPWDCTFSQEKGFPVIQNTSWEVV